MVWGITCQRGHECCFLVVVRLMKSLLIGAKLRFADSGGYAGVELCDTYVIWHTSQPHFC